MSSSSTIRTAVIPAAGLGTRLLPASKAVPKELMPIAGRPLIQFAVEEAVASGMERIILVLSRSKRLVARYFQSDLILEHALLRCGKNEEAAQVRRLSQLAEIRVVWQKAPLGLADAIRTARACVHAQPFAVILPDVLINSHVPCLRQLLKCYERHRGCILATRTVARSLVHRFGILDAVPVTDSCCSGRTLHVKSLLERPQPEMVRSRYGIFGRYILLPEIFAAIDSTRPGYGGELQLTDALASCVARVPIYGYCFQGTHFDVGSKLGLLQAGLAYGLCDPELAGPLRQYVAAVNGSVFSAPAKPPVRATRQS